VIESRRIKLSEHVACMIEMKNAYRSLVLKLVCVEDGKIILK